MEVLQVTRRLVAIDSQNPGPGEAAIAADIEADCRGQGFEVRRVELVPGRPNLLVTADRGPGPHLGLAGHLDTKPVGDAATQWRSDPFELTVSEGLAYGLGATDMKGGVAAMLLALRRFADGGGSGRLTLVLSADEEQGSGAGAKALAEAGLPDLEAIVIGEPSGLDAPWEALYLVSRGICCFEVEIRTAQGHSGLSERLGRNAVQLAADLLHALEGFRPPLAEPGPIPCSPTVNPGMLVHGGVCFGTWPGLCSVAVEIRLVPGMERDQVRAAIERLVGEVVGDAGTALVSYAEGSLGWMPAVALDPETAVVRAAQRAARRTLGAMLPLAAYPGGTDATYFLGRAGIPTITSLGPGSLPVAHGPNEYVEVDQLRDAVDLYAALAEEFCDGTGGP
ncbi:MAG: M20/M25/M40 family metallo-hydrolase [Streptosporangiales bacterium]|nr:M20/M25/M40 family metallo-hydrolase [Streptosporangiales bacterium]